MVSCFMCQFVNAVGYSWLINRNCLLTFDVLFYLSFWCDHINQFGYLLIFAVGKRFIVLQKKFCCVSVFITIVQHVFLIHLFRMWKESVNWFKVECSTCSVRAIHFSRAHYSKTGQDRPRKLWVVLLELKYYPDIKLQVPAVRYTRMPCPLGVRGQARVFNMVSGQGDLHSIQGIWLLQNGLWPHFSAWHWWLCNN